MATRPDRWDEALHCDQGGFMHGITAPELMALRFEPIRYVVPGFIAEGLTVLAGAPKARKSWMALDIAVAVASGGMAFGAIPCPEGDVLFLALEDNRRRLQGRLRKMRVIPPPERLTFFTEWPTGIEAVEGVELWARRVKRPTLVIVDVLARIREFTGRDASYEADYRALIALQDLASRLDLAIVVIHHTRKAGADDPFDEVSGTRGLTAGADTVLVVRRDNSGGPSFRAMLYGRGRDIPEIESAIEFDEDLYRWKVVGDAWRLADTAERQAILNILTRQMRVKEIAELVDKSVANVSKMLVKMAKAGLVSNPSYGCYAPVESVETVEVTAVRRASSTSSTTSTLCPREERSSYTLGNLD
jgi:hypothetical protein